MRKRVSDIIAESIVKHGIEDVFMITGGGAMHLNDAFGRCRDLNIVFNHNEQASSISAEAYYRYSGRVAALNPTTGPGGINALNGVYGAFVDSMAMVVISGQIKRDTMLRNSPLPLRQLGDQEVDIIPIVKPITKYATVLQDERKVKEVVSKAVYLAAHGRPGPVWIDVPMDVQGALVEEDELSDWEPTEASLKILRGDVDLHPNTLADFTLFGRDELLKSADEIYGKLKESKRPLIFAGNGIRLAGCVEELRELLSRLGIPCVTGWGGHDLLPNSHPSFAGRPGIAGDRPGNFSVQNSDFMLILGTRLNIRHVSYDWSTFAPDAYKIHVDIDVNELSKHTMRNNVHIHADLRDLMPLLIERSEGWKRVKSHEEYRDWCVERVKKYPVLQDRHVSSDKLNPFHFLSYLSSLLNHDEVVVAANGSAFIMGFLTAEVKEKTRLLANYGDASMGYDLPASIGVAAAGAKRVICLAGDGSIMMNLQELQTIAGNKLPIIIFVINNKGYLSIKQTQNLYFPDNIVGIDDKTGVTFPDFVKVAESFGIPACAVKTKEEMSELLPKILASGGPFLCDVHVDPEQGFEPKLVSKKLDDGTMISPALDDMFPFLSDEEMRENRLA